MDQNRLLDFYKQIFEKETDSEKDFWNKLSNIQKKDIEDGLADLKNGKRKKVKDVYGKI